MNIRQRPRNRRFAQKYFAPKWSALIGPALIWFALALTASLGAPGCSTPDSRPDDARPAAKQPVELRLIAFNDFHGNLEAPAGEVTVDGTQVDAGGIAYLKAYADALGQQASHAVVVSAGDLVGASPLASAVFHDEPTIEAMNQLGLEFTAVGNHEFDEGWQELRRLQRGGCHPEDGCQDGTPFDGASFEYLAANVDTDTDGPLVGNYEVKDVGGVPVGFVGLVLDDAPDVVSPAALKGLTFRHEPTVINDTAATLQSRGVETIVVLLHEGGRQSDEQASFNDCGNLSGPIVDIVKASSDAVDVFVTGHTHQAYICSIDGKLVTSALSYGRLLTTIDLTIDPTSGDVVAKTATNHVVYDDQRPPNGPMQALVDRWTGRSAKLAGRQVGSAAGLLSREPNGAGESGLGDVIADAQLAATSAPDAGGARVAFMNPGGIRANLGSHDATARAPVAVSYEQLYRAQPFGNHLVTMTLTGAQLHTLLEQQWAGQHPNFLQVSAGFTYTWSPTEDSNDRVVPSSIEIHGQPIDLDADYRITVNNFLAAGGDGFSVLKNGRHRRAGPVDVDAFSEYVETNAPVSPGPQDRIHRQPPKP